MEEVFLQIFISTQYFICIYTYILSLKSKIELRLVYVYQRYNCVYSWANVYIQQTTIKNLIILSKAIRRDDRTIKRYHTTKVIRYGLCKKICHHNKKNEDKYLNRSYHLVQSNEGGG